MGSFYYLKKFVKGAIMKFVCVGAGSIGKRHLKNLLAIGTKHEDISVVETREDRREEVVGLGIHSVFTSLDLALSKRQHDAGLICSPTNLHIPQAIQLAEAGCHILMEKPLAHNLDESNLLRRLIEENELVLLMAYIFRFSPLTSLVKKMLSENRIGKVLYVRGEFSEYLPDWHPYEDYRSFYMANKSEGGGSILDQSHIMDLIHHLFGSFKAVKAFNGKISSLEINADDYSEMLLEMESGVIASIHTDIFGRDHKKQLEIKGESGNILWDSNSNTVSLYSADTKDKVIYEDFAVDFNLNYLEEIQHFIRCCGGQESPVASLDTGIETMELILAAERSARNNLVEKV
ncbi:Gfo/Idh/MocA family oxidoreductase [Alphaproteobacteria bacterium]|nr:Gfo/Idh/MocA family oxidoreductase [Alphaproteobacteria bacterium]